MANQMAILRKVLRRIRRYWVGLVASLLLATLYVVMSLYIPIPLQTIMVTKQRTD